MRQSQILNLFRGLVAALCSHPYAKCAGTLLRLREQNMCLRALFCTRGVFWTKFEQCMNKIRRILTTDARAERVVTLSQIVRSDCVVKRTNAPRTRSRTRVCKNQKISLHFSRASSPHPSTAKRPRQWKGNFWFCFATRKLHKGQQSYHIEAHLLHFLVATEALPYPRFVVVRESAHTTQSPRIGRSHLLTKPARCLLRIRSVASFEPVVNQKTK